MQRIFTDLKNGSRLMFLDLEIIDLGKVGAFVEREAEDGGMVMRWCDRRGY